MNYQIVGFDAEIGEGVFAGKRWKEMICLGMAHAVLYFEQ